MFRQIFQNRKGGVIKSIYKTKTRNPKPETLNPNRVNRNLNDGYFGQPQRIDDGICGPRGLLLYYMYEEGAIGNPNGPEPVDPTPGQYTPSVVFGGLGSDNPGIAVDDGGPVTTTTSPQTLNSLNPKPKRQLSKLCKQNYNYYQYASDTTGGIYFRWVSWGEVYMVQALTLGFRVLGLGSRSRLIQLPKKPVRVDCMINGVTAHRVLRLRLILLVAVARQ